MLGISQEGNPSNLVETMIHYQYTYIKSKILSLCQFLVLMPYNLTVVKNPLLSTHLILRPMKRLGIVTQMQIK